MTLYNRSFQTEADFAAMGRLLVELLGRAGPPTYATIGDIDWWRAVDNDLPIEIVQLWFDGERLVAFAWPVDDQVDIVVDPDYPTLHDKVLAWAEETYPQWRGVDAQKPLRAWSFTSDLVRAGALAARGYQRTNEGLIYYTRAVATVAPSQLPPGYTFDYVRGEADVARRTAVHRAAFERSQMTEATMRAVLASPTYRPELDVVIVAPDGSYTAFALLWLDEANRAGIFEPVGVSAAHRRLGLGRAILDEGVRRLDRLDARVAYVQTNFTNAPAQALYEASGFTELDRNYAWSLATGGDATQ